MTDIFPELDANTVVAATLAKWDLSGPLPVPRPGWLACPVCRHDIVQARFWKFHTRESPNIRGRCDVSFKCTSCAAVWCHGVALDRETFARMIVGHENQVEWREARWILRRFREESRASDASASGRNTHKAADKAVK